MERLSRISEIPSNMKMCKLEYWANQKCAQHSPARAERPPTRGVYPERRSRIEGLGDDDATRWAHAGETMEAIELSGKICCVVVLLYE